MILNVSSPTPLKSVVKKAFINEVPVFSQRHKIILSSIDSLVYRVVIRKTITKKMKIVV